MSETRNTQYWEKAPSDERPKSMEEFREEVKAKIGLDFESIVEGEPEEMIGSASLLAFENWRVVGVDMPEKDPETGEETYHEFKRINMGSE